MSVKYKLYQNNHRHFAHRGMWYARSVMTNTICLKQIAERIQRNCSLKRSDVVAVLIELVEVMRDELQASHRVVIDGLGSFKIGLSTQPATSPYTFSAAKNIKGAHINFLPSVEVDTITGKRVKYLLAGMSVSEYDKYAVSTDSEDMSTP